jgi:glycosyltransferase involved in cell wall biosynthesis
LKSLIIVDLLPHSSGGHFRVWLERTLLEAARHHDDIVAYLGEDSDAGSLDPECHRTSARIAFHDVRKVRSVFDGGSRIFAAITAHQRRRHRGLGEPPVLVMWGEHLLNQDVHFPPARRWWSPGSSAPFNRPWGTFFSFASLAYDGAPPHEQESRLHQLIGADDLCRGAFCWDAVVARQLGGKLIYLPNVEDLMDDPGWRVPETRGLVLGSVGQLWGYRSVNLLAEMVGREAGVSFFAAGQLFPDSYSPEAAAMTATPPPNWRIEPGRLPDEAALNERLRGLDGFVLDSRTYKVPSGLAIRAMALGRPLVSLPDDSWAARHITEDGIGVFWERGAGNLARLLREWSAGGGPDRARRLACRLSDRAGLGAAYAEMFRRLSSGRMDGC